MKWKRITGVAAGVLSVFFTLSAFLYAGVLNRAQTVGTGKTFYFLVSDSANLEVSTQVAQLQGGAGYSLVYENGEYAAYAVYFSESEIEIAQASVAQTGENAEIVVLQCSPLYLKSVAEKESAATITGAFRSLYGCMQVLENEISRLEQGATQESSKRILTTLSRQFAYLGTTYSETVVGYGKACKNAKARLSEAIAGVVYAKDLRYLLCELSVAYVDLSKNFSL